MSVSALWHGLPSVTALERSVAPAVTPINVFEAKAQANVVHDDDDFVIESHIAAAVDMLDGEGELGRAMITQTWAQWVPQSPGCVKLRMGPFQSLSAIHYYDADGVLQAANTADFEIRKSGDFVTVEPKSGEAWPVAANRADAIRITYVAGFGDSPSDVPAGIRHALLLMVAHWYENREAVGEKAMHEVPMAVTALINRHRVGWYG